LLGKELHTFQGHQDQVLSVCFSPDGQAIASSSADYTIKVWSLSGEELHTFQGHQGWVRTVSFSPDGKTLASGSEDHTVILWNWDLDHLLQRSQAWLGDYLHSRADGPTP
jgi:WD40 repeat protein